MNQNLISATLTDAQRDAILAVTAAQTKMTAATPSPEDPPPTKISADMTLLDQALQFAQQNGAMPADVNLAALARTSPSAPIPAHLRQADRRNGGNCMSALSDACGRARHLPRGEALNTSGSMTPLCRPGQRFARRSRQQPHRPPP
ncbi:MAG: hypothetical protein U1F81_19835 [Verrucomicrobiaceae bacterium]